MDFSSPLLRFQTLTTVLRHSPPPELQIYCISLPESRVGHVYTFTNALQTHSLSSKTLSLSTTWTPSYPRPGWKFPRLSSNTKCYNRPRRQVDELLVCEIIKLDLNQTMEKCCKIYFFHVKIFFLENIVIIEHFTFNQTEPKGRGSTIVLSASKLISSKKRKEIKPN